MNRPPKYTTARVGWYVQLAEQFTAELHQHNEAAAKHAPLLGAARNAEHAYQTCIRKYGTMRDWRSRATHADNEEANMLDAARHAAASAWREACQDWHAERRAIEAHWESSGLSADDQENICYRLVPPVRMEQNDYTLWPLEC